MYLCCIHSLRKRLNGSEITTRRCLQPLCNIIKYSKNQHNPPTDWISMLNSTVSFFRVVVDECPNQPLKTNFKCNMKVLLSNHVHHHIYLLSIARFDIWLTREQEILFYGNLTCVLRYCNSV